MSAKICFMCNDALSATTSLAKSYSEGGIPPCGDCLNDLIEANEDAQAAEAESHND